MLLTFRVECDSGPTARGPPAVEPMFARGCDEIHACDSGRARAFICQRTIRAEGYAVSEEPRVWLGIFTFSPEEKARRRAHREAIRKPRSTRDTPFTEIAPDGACPNCGGTSFTAKRSRRGKLGFGVFASKSQVRCVTCGRTYKRG